MSGSMIAVGLRFLLAGLIAWGVAACAVRSLEIAPVTLEDPPQHVESPVKAHLKNGSTIVFNAGIEIRDGIIRGRGRAYDLALDGPEVIWSVPVADVAAMETIQTPVNKGASGALTIAGTAAAAAVAPVLIMAIFGSCPTIYSHQDGRDYLEAESFSYSIARSFEARDVDRLGFAHVKGDHLELEIRNEALETHYINQFNLLEVRHEQAQAAYPDPEGNVIVVGPATADFTATDRDGVALKELVTAADDKVWRTSEARLTRAGIGDFQDYIDLEFDSGELGPEFALRLRLRNSLLNTVLLYDIMLKQQGFGGLDWLGRDLNRLPDAARLALWYRLTMGMHIARWDGERFVPIAYIPDAGPIAWKETAVVLQASSLPTTRLRLSFVADNWRIDTVSAHPDYYRAEVLTIPPAIVRIGGDHSERAAEYLREADSSYITTGPGGRLSVRFELPPPRSGQARTWMVAAHGYYIEWLRGEWLQTPAPKRFRPGHESLAAALSIWRKQRDTFRRQFEAVRFPVR